MGKLSEATEEEIARRQFGPGREQPCRNPGVILCTYWECQVANECRWNGRPEKPSPFPDSGRRALAEGEDEG